MSIRCITDDCMNALPNLADNSVDSIVTDPPYEIGFMGKSWDKSGIAYNVDMWKECLRVLKPGGHLVSFGGTRTYHRLVVAIEDAGFEIRDQLQWIYGSGFPKSMNVSKAIDAKNIFGKSNSRNLRHVEQNGIGQSYTLTGRNNGIMGEPRVYERKVFTPSTNLAVEWRGWGTAVKPAFEPIILAYKPHEAEHGIILANLIKLEAQVWLMWFASTAEWNSTSSPSELSEVLSIAQWTVAELISTRDDLCGQMDMSQFAEAMTLCLNIVTSWKNIWNEASNAGNTFITETVLSPIIGWTTLKSSLSHLTPNFITRELMQHGIEWLNVLSAASPFIVASKKLKSTLELIAVERAISRTSNPASIDSKITNEPIVLARKPLSGTIAETVSAWGTGGLNIDACRIDTEDASMRRWPANVLFDEDAAQLLDKQDKVSRFFYVAKASRNERDTGLEHLQLKREADRIKDDGAGGDNPRNRTNIARLNYHPTVKPIALMQYLIRLITPNNGTILDPFMGSGTTGCAAVLLQNCSYAFIGIESNSEYMQIAETRIQYFAEQGVQKEMEL